MHNNNHAPLTLSLLILDINITGKCIWSGCCERKREKSTYDVIFWKLDEETGRGLEVKMKKVETITRR